MPEFSVLMSVYAKEKPDFLEASLESIVTQSLSPTEIVLVKDGPLSQQLDHVLDGYRNRFGNLFKIVSLPQNMGLGKALRFGLDHVSYDIVARMDSDDIADPRRFEKQVSFLLSNPDCDVVGSSIVEFVHSPYHISGYRAVPENHDAIYRTAKWKNPLNHMTVVFRKNKVLAAGGYQDVPHFEDFDLWIRMLSMGMRFSNLKEALVFSRIGNDMIGRRHGYAYSKREIRFFRRVNKLGFISAAQLYGILIARIPLRLIPKQVLKLFYTLALRKREI